MLIAVVSDTHGFLDPRALKRLQQSQCDALIHGGDIGSPVIIEALETVTSVYGVRGNNDWDEYGSEFKSDLRITLDGVRFYVSHYPQDPRQLMRRYGLTPGEPLPHVCIHGHTHVPELRSGANASPFSLIFCPGALYRPRRQNLRTLGFIRVDEGKLEDAWIEDLDGHPVDGLSLRR